MIEFKKYFDSGIIEKQNIMSNVGPSLFAKNSKKNNADDYYLLYKIVFDIAIIVACH